MKLTVKEKYFMNDFLKVINYSHALTIRTLPKQCMLQCPTRCENLRKRTSKEVTRHQHSKTVHH